MILVKNNLVKLGLIISIISTAGTLYFSEILKFTPCELCWYQRIFMYPLVVIFSISIWKKDKNVAFFALPLSILGLIISIYHNLLYFKIIPESIQPCTIGASCTAKQIEWFGFITIPFLSFLSFLTITILMLIHEKYSNNKNK